MNPVIKKSYASYRMVNGYISAWERGKPGEGHHVTVLDQDEHSVTFPWRSPDEPAAGEKISLIMVESGASLRPKNPVMILNHDSGRMFREPNAPQPKGVRRIMIGLGFWMGFALLISAALLVLAHGVIFQVITLMAAAMMVWRLGIATSDLRADERAFTRLREEEQMCLEVMTSAWRLASGQVFELTRKKHGIEKDDA